MSDNYIDVTTDVGIPTKVLRTIPVFRVAIKDDGTFDVSGDAMDSYYKGTELNTTSFNGTVSIVLDDTKDPNYAAVKSLLAALLAAT